MADLAGILADLAAESAELDALVAHLDAAGWATPTPAPGWTIAHQIAHLAWTDDLALRAVTDPAAVRPTVLARVAGDPYSFVDAAAGSARSSRRGELLRRVARRAGPRWPTRWPASRRARSSPWFGPPMSAASMATARLMETWAHGQDVADALGCRRDADRPAAARRPPRRPHPRLRLPGPRPDAAGRGVPRRADRAGRRRVDVGRRRRRAAGHRPGPRLLPARHPAPPPRRPRRARGGRRRRRVARHRPGVRRPARRRPQAGQFR